MDEIDNFLDSTIAAICTFFIVYIVLSIAAGAPL